MIKKSLTFCCRESNQIPDYYGVKKCGAVYTGSHSFELLLGTEWRDCGTTGCGSGFNDHLYRYVSQRYKVNERLTGWIWFQCADTFTFRQRTCLNFHLPRCRQSTMPPHRLLPPPCRLKIHSASFD